MLNLHINQPESQDSGLIFLIMDKVLIMDKEITIEDILTDPRIDGIIRSVLGSIYYFRPKLPEGPRNVFDSLNDKHIISLDHYENLKNAYRELLNRTLKMPYRERKAVKYIIEKSIQTFYIKYLSNVHKKESGNESSNQQ